MDKQAERQADGRSHSSVLSDFMKAANELVRHPESSDYSVTIVGATLRFMEDEPDKFDAYLFPEELEDDEM